MLQCMTKKINIMSKKKLVLVGMSGGVDSSVAAALMHREGYEVVGVTLQLSQAEKKIRSCCSEKDIQDAHDVAMQMGFPHYTIDYSDNFKTHVVDDFVAEYTSGRTPNPCVRCNQKIKFGDLLEFAKKIKADYVATGHYVKHVEKDEVEFHRPKDANKDQTYFMALVQKEYLPMILFPLGGYYKSEIREIAERLELPVAKKRESQDLCFIQNGSYRDILRKIAEKTNKGVFVDASDNILGYHEGFENYTIGQRKGIEVNDGPWFALKIIAPENKVVIGRKEELSRNSFHIDQVNFLTNTLPKQMLAQVRARHIPVLCEFDPQTSIVHLKEPAMSIAPGQICAFYEGDRLLGGGRIIYDS